MIDRRELLAGLAVLPVAEVALQREPLPTAEAWSPSRARAEEATAWAELRAKPRDGVVSMAELRFSFMNRIPGLLDSRSRQMGITSSELLELVRKREVEWWEIRPVSWTEAGNHAMALVAKRMLA